MQIKKIFLFSIVFLLLLIVAFYPLFNSRHFQVFGDIISQIETEKKIVALTLDDGPSIPYTDPVLQILNTHNIKATFFVVGKETHQFIDHAKKIVQQGHELGNHSYTHSRLLFKPLSTIRQEIEKTDAAIRLAGYQGDISFRAPYGNKFLVLPWYLKQNNRSHISWSLGPDSASTDIKKEPEIMAQYVLDNIQPGSIILLHVMYKNGETSREALPLIIRSLQQQGYEFVTISELLSHRKP